MFRFSKEPPLLCIMVAHTQMWKKSLAAFGLLVENDLTRIQKFGLFTILEVKICNQQKKILLGNFDHLSFVFDNTAQNRSYLVCWRQWFVDASAGPYGKALPLLAEKPM